jgi:hypothetical protein
MSDIYNGRMIPLKIADMAIINCNKEIEKLQIENARLKADIERLTKAGDAICESPYLWETDPAVIEWRAAKEGKLP